MEGDKAEDVPDVPDVPDAPREYMIATAVKFLQNPKVLQSPPSQKRTFLEKKGMTKEEIDESFTRAGVSEVVVPQGSNSVAMTPGGVYPQGPQMAVLAQTVPESKWSKFRDYTATAIVTGGFVYGIYFVYKKYVIPLWYGPSQEERHLQAIQKSISDLQENIKEMLSCIQKVQGTVSSQQKEIENMSPGGLNKKHEDRFVTEVKDEIKSLKGLLLSRKQFPPTPNTQPVLPVWQLAASKSDKVISEETTDTSTSEGPGLSEIDSHDNTTTVSMVTETEPQAGVSMVTETKPQPKQQEVGDRQTDVSATGSLEINGRGSGEVIVKKSDVDNQTEDEVLLNGHLTNGDLDTADEVTCQSSSLGQSSGGPGSTVVTKAEVILEETKEVIAS